MKRNLTFHTDPNHGWLEVPLGDLTTLGVADNISAYSYQDKTNAYLEEDVDAGVYLRAAGEVGWSVTTEDRYVDGESFVPRLPPYGS